MWVGHPRGSWGLQSTVVADNGHGNSKMHKGVGSWPSEAGWHLVARGAAIGHARLGNSQPRRVGRRSAVVAQRQEVIGDVARVSIMRPWHV